MRLNRRKIINGVIVFLIAVAVLLPSTLLILEKRTDTEEKVIQSFAVNYGTHGTLKMVQKVKNIYVVLYESDITNFTLLYIDGLWVELGGVSKIP